MAALSLIIKYFLSNIFRLGLYSFSSARNSLELRSDRESLLQCNNTGTVSSLQLYRLDTSTNTCLLTGNGHVAGTRAPPVRYACTQHGPVKCYADQGTQTVKTFRGKNTKRSLLSAASHQFSRSRSRMSLAFSRRSLGRQCSSDTTSSLPLANTDTSASRQSFVEYGEANGKKQNGGETSFTKRNIKSQVSCSHNLAKLS